MKTRVREQLMGRRFILLASAIFGAAVGACNEDETEADASSDVSSDADATDVQDVGGEFAPNSCQGQDPSQTCRDTGCGADQTCQPADGCVPSSCLCGDAGWECTADCGENYACVETQVACPAEAPEDRSECRSVLNNQRCTFDEVCCCGACSPKLACDCDNNEWFCYQSSVCDLNSCQGRSCESDADCVVCDVRDPDCENPIVTVCRVGVCQTP